MELNEVFGLFRLPTYTEINARRLEHLATLGIDFSGRSILELGAGVGDLTGYFVNRDCSVTLVEGRAEAVRILEMRFAQSTTIACDLDQPLPDRVAAHDVVFAYGLLYHLADPSAALGGFASRAKDLLLLETCVAVDAEAVVYAAKEEKTVATQALNGMGCRPTRSWLMRELRKHFDHVYVPVTQPAHPEFPTDWSKAAPDERSRAIFVAAHKPLGLSTLTEELLAVQPRQI